MQPRVPKPLLVVIALVILLAVLPPAAGPVAGQGPLLLPPPDCSAGKVADGRDATVTRKTPVMKAGPLVATSGSFKAPEDPLAYCDPPVVFECGEQQTGMFPGSGSAPETGGWAWAALRRFRLVALQAVRLDLIVPTAVPAIGVSCRWVACT